jgi:hypothetical protein
MKTRIENTANAVRRAILLGALSLTCSAAALGQISAAPHIDWIELAGNEYQDEALVDVEIGWSQHGLAPVSSVQFRVDGLPVMSRPVEAGQNYGDGLFPVHGDGAHELAVTLCNADGCGEPTAVMITMESPEIEGASIAQPAPAGNDAEIARELERIHASTERLAREYGSFDRGLSPTSSAYSALASTVAKAALSGFVEQGAGYAFDSLMDHLGFGSDSFGMQIDELHSSIDALSVQVAQLTTAIEALEDQANWQGFLNQHKDANSAVNLIYANFGYVTGWVENGILVDDFAWTTARQNIADSLTILAGARLNASGGIVDTRDGAIYQLMNAIPQRVASVDSYWPLVDEYRDYYRAAIAMAFLGLDLIEDSFDGSGTTRVMADDALLVGQRSVLAMYGYGVAPQLPEGLDFVQVRGSVEGFGSTELGEVDDAATIQYQAWWLRNAFGYMATQYRPEHHDGLTMEEFLVESAVPTSYVLENTGGWKGTGWQVIKVDAGTPHLGIPPRYTLKLLVGRVSDNSWQESYENFCQGGLCPFPVYAWNDSELHAAISEIKAEIRSRGGYRLIDGTFAQSHYGMIDLTDRLNHAGRAAEFDPEAVRVAAFGDGAQQIVDERSEVLWQVGPFE